MKSNKCNIIAIIPAAGKGNRMNTSSPKQYIKINKKTIIEHTLHCLMKENKISRFIVSLRENDNLFYKLEISNNKSINTVIGGEKRSDSVLSGLNYITNNLNIKDCWVLIHDAVRPLINRKDMKKIFYYIEKNKAPHGGILAAPVQDTIKKSIKGKKNIKHTIQRNRLWHAMTPQFFPLKLIKHCLFETIKKKF